MAGRRRGRGPSDERRRRLCLRERAEQARLVEERCGLAVLRLAGERGEVPEGLIDAAALLVERLEARTSFADDQPGLVGGKEELQADL